MLDDMIYGKMMMGVSAKVVKTTMGNYSSSYVLLTSVVLGVASAMSASLLPSVVASKQHGDFETINEKLKATVKANMFIAMPCFIGLFVLGEPIVAMLFSSYDSHQGGVMLKLGAVAVIFYTLATVTTTTLQGIDKLNVPIYHNIVALAVHIPLLIILLKTTDLGIYAIVIGNASFPILVMLLNLISLYKYTGYTQEIIQSIGVPFVCALFMGICTYGVYKLFFNISGRVIIGLFFGFIIAAVTYFGSMFLYEKKLKPIIMNRDYYDD
jgi:stage V sporulation protein B